MNIYSCNYAVACYYHYTIKGAYSAVQNLWFTGFCPNIAHQY